MYALKKLRLGIKGQSGSTKFAFSLLELELSEADSAEVRKTLLQFSFLIR